MANCAQCNNDIIFGGVKAEGLRFCRQSCHDQFMQHRARVQRTSEAYQAALAQLRRNPADSTLKEKALTAGRAHASATRQGGGVTVFDEVALANDIRAASAVPPPSAPPVAPSLSIEQRLLRLEDFRARSLISDQEYQAKRKELLAEL